MKIKILITVLSILTCNTELYSQKYDARYEVNGEIEVNSKSKINLDISNLSEAYSKTGIHNLGNGEYVSIDIDPKPANLQYVDYYIHAERSARQNFRDYMKGSEFNGYRYKETKKSHQKVYGNGKVYALYKIYFKISPKENNQNLIKSQITDLKYYQDRGYNKLQSNDYYGAISDYTKAIEIDPIDYYAYQNRGIAKFYLRDLNGAISDCTKAIEIDPNKADGYTIRGDAKFWLQDFVGAINDYYKAIEIDPTKYIYKMIGQAKYYSGDYYGAISDFTKAIEIDPKSDYAYNKRGDAKHSLKDYYGAISDYTKAIEIDPNDGEGYFNRANSNFMLNNSADACRDFKKSIELGFNDYLDLSSKLVNCDFN